MTRIARRFLILLFALLAATPAAFAQAQRAVVHTYSQAELDQMLAPIALYPDPLLSQVLMAATYPAEVNEAARWSRANPGLQGDNAVRAAQNKDWDPSVKSLTAFPQVLARMDENLDWTRKLGEAFLAHQPQVMDTVQQLRRRAQAAGNLQSSERMRVQQQRQAIVVQPVSPQYVDVPYYDPLEVYGPWWWPAYQPVVWAPWPGYARPYRPGVSVGFWWGRPIGLSGNFFFGNFDWHRRQVRVVHPTAYYYRAPFAANRTVAVAPHRWQHEPRRREAFAERRPLQVRQQIQTQSQVQPQQRQQSRSQAVALTSIQAQPAARAQPSGQVQPRRKERERARIERRETRQAQPQVQPQPRAQPEVRPQPQARPQPEARPKPQVRQEQRPRMPEAQAPQQPRAERPEQRQERRNERGHKGRERS